MQLEAVITWKLDTWVHSLVLPLSSWVVLDKLAFLPLSCFLNQMDLTTGK